MVGVLWSWVAGLSWNTFVATVAGAVVAFTLERGRRKRERTTRDCAKANALIATLDRMRYVLTKLDAQLPAVKSEEPTEGTFEPLEAIPASLPSIEFRDIDFLLESEAADDACAKAYNRVALVQAKFDSVVAKVRVRNDLASRYQGVRGELVLGRGEEFLQKLTASSSFTMPLRFYARELAASIPTTVSLIEQVTSELRAALAVRFPGRQFLDPFAETRATPSP